MLDKEGGTGGHQSNTDSTSLRRVLGIPSLVFFGLAYISILTVFTTYGLVTIETKGHLPAAYVVTIFTMFFTAFSYACMVKIHPIAGSAYSYTRRAFGSNTGFLVGWALLLDYVFLPIINFMIIGLYMSRQFPAIPPYAWIIGAIALITLLNILGVKMAMTMNFVIISCQAVFLVIFLVLSFSTLTNPDAPSIFAPFYSADLNFQTILAGAAILCLSFLGFDAITTLSEEAKNPTRAVPLAIILCVLIAGTHFIITSWAGHIAFPHWQQFVQADTAAFQVVASFGSKALTIFFTTVYISGSFASAMASQVSVARILYSMGRDSVLPKSIFAIISKRFGTPIGAIIVVSFISLLALILPLKVVISVVSFGALIAFTFVNLSVIKVFIVDEKRRKPLQLVIYGIFPIIGFCFTIWLWTSLSFLTFEIGFAWFVIGLIYMFYKSYILKQSVGSVLVDKTPDV